MTNRQEKFTEKFLKWIIYLYMKITSIRAFMIVALIIILLYAFGLFLPIIKHSKPQSKLQINFNSIFIKNV